MTPEETKGNKLIAEFRGGIYKSDLFEIRNGFIWLPYHNLVRIEDLKYNSSWEWLMPVIHECWEVTTEEEREFKGLTLFELGLFTPIEELFAAVVEFIEWYNKTKK